MSTGEGIIINIAFNTSACYMVNIKNITTEGLDDLMEILTKLEIHPLRIVLNSLFSRHDNYELVDGKLVETPGVIRPRLGNKSVPNMFSTSRYEEFGGVGYVTEGYVIDAEFVNEPGPLQLIFSRQRYSQLSLVMTAPMKMDNSQPVFVRDLPRYAYDVGMKFDLSDESVRDAMSGIADRRIPVQYFTPGDNRSTMYGREVEKDKYDVRIVISLQNPDSRYLDCYVGSLWSNRMEDGKLKGVEHADDLPEFKFQANEGHFCNTDEDKDTYPLVPIGIDKIRNFSMALESDIHTWNSSEKPLFTVTGDVPLALDRSNELYVRGFLGPGHFFEVRRFPNQDMMSEAAILYRRPSSLASVVEDLNAGMQEMQSVKMHFEGVFNN